MINSRLLAILLVLLSTSVSRAELTCPSKEAITVYKHWIYRFHNHVELFGAALLNNILSTDRPTELQAKFHDANFGVLVACEHMAEYFVNETVYEDFCPTSCGVDYCPIENLVGIPTAQLTGMYYFTVGKLIAKENLEKKTNKEQMKEMQEYNNRLQDFICATRYLQEEYLSEEQTEQHGNELESFLSDFEVALLKSKEVLGEAKEGQEELCDHFDYFAPKAAKSSKEPKATKGPKATKTPK
mmetsp:Transcript_447/g.606  ORF Transcript_447/g.606 Transcript_447/m.606 type:complete len:242 (+) Transcript_447:170-895(+)|eukprot:CAMPEP_0198137000 /NCGR_PEP_ID=MMETSP1443-20131203/544_1 /TAXON_ID=186043 /ORGANISM="Entomoneis sp., Strain CCMP2396" /LENGTH=241 /DNA_ID=CAMNT_0043798313 /DNA_START=112 /DNA_END=837 /DNA_ORIENTATION=-